MGVISALRRGGGSKLNPPPGRLCTVQILHYIMIHQRIQKQKPLMRENFKLKNKNERANKKESVEGGGDPGEEREKKKEGEKEKEKEKAEKQKKPKKKRRKEKRKKENLVRQRQYGKFLHNREGRSPTSSLMCRHTHMASTLLPYSCSLHSTDLEEMGRNKQPAGPTKMVD